MSSVILMGLADKLSDVLSLDSRKPHCGVHLVTLNKQWMMRIVEELLK